MIALTVIACGSTTTKPLTQTTPPARCTGLRSAFGTICEVKDTAAVSGNHASPGDPVKRGGNIIVDTNSGVLFWVSQKINYCEIFGSGTPAAPAVWSFTGSGLQVVLRSIAGAVACSMCGGSVARTPAIQMPSSVSFRDLGRGGREGGDHAGYVDRVGAGGDGSSHLREPSESVPASHVDGWRA